MDVEGNTSFFNFVNECASHVISGIVEIAFRGRFVSIFRGVRILSVSFRLEGEAVVVAGSCREGELSVLCIYEVKRKVGGGIKEAEDVFEDVFFSVGVDRSRGFLFFVEVHECGVRSSSRATVLINTREVLRVFLYDESIEERFDIGTKVDITRNVGFSGVGFVVWIEGTGSLRIGVDDVASVVEQGDGFDSRSGDSVLTKGLVRVDWLVKFKRLVS
jgi:hypothetical protein